MGIGMDKLILAMDAADEIEHEDIAGDDSGLDSGADLHAPVDFADLDDVLGRMFAVVEKSATGDDQAWYHYLNDWDRRFVLNLYDRQITTGSCPISEKQAQKAKVDLPGFSRPRIS